MLLFEREDARRAPPALVALLERELLARDAPLPLLFDAPVPLAAPAERAPLPVERVPLVLRAVLLFFAGPVLRDEAPPPRPPELEPPDDEAAPPVRSSIDHLPDITRCAASATASAINEPRRVALDTIEFAALLAVSAASIPASRIFLRALGLALIAAAAAARPAASISLLIAALVILSTVVSSEPDEDRPEELLDDDLRLPDFAPDFAIVNLPVSLNFVRHMKLTRVPLRPSKARRRRTRKDALKSLKSCPRAAFS